MLLARHLVIASLLLTPIVLAAQPRSATPTIAPETWAGLPWRTIGPEGNRFSSAAGISGDPHTYYVGERRVVSGKPQMVA